MEEFRMRSSSGIILCPLSDRRMTHFPMDQSCQSQDGKCGERERTRWTRTERNARLRRFLICTPGTCPRVSLSHARTNRFCQIAGASTGTRA
ncbi:hypothetical protein IWW55_002966, partial [Coemansia sp. RSA 2706]